MNEADGRKPQSDPPPDEGLPAAPSVAPELDPHDAYAALRIPDYRYYVSGNLLASLGLQMQKVAVGWEIVARLQHDPRAAAMAWAGSASCRSCR